MKAVVAALLLATCTAWTTPASAGPGAASAATQDGSCGTGSWVAGTIDLCAGQLVYRDYVYDSFGARPGPPPPVSQITNQLLFQSIPNFDAYGGLPPAGGQKDGDQTDLVALRMTVDATTVHVTAELNTMFVPDAAKLGVAIDRDDNSATDMGAWPDFVAGTSGSTPLHTTGADELHVATVGDPTTNTIALDFARPPGTTWRVWAVVAKADGTAMNVAFRGIDETGFWWDDHQASALANGDVTSMAATVDVADLTNGVTRRAPSPVGQVVERVYVSQYNPGIGEGIDDKGVPGPGYAPGSPGEAVSQAFTLLGKYQPYGFYEPAQPGPHGLQMTLHGLAQNHSDQLYFPGTPGNYPHVMGDENNRIIATPLGRGWKGWYSSYSERDVMDVLADVEAHYAVDPDRVLMSGYSMGGYGTMRLAALHPDVFAGAVNWVGYTGDEFNGTPFGGQFAASGSNVGADVNAIDLLGSLRHVPMVSLYSGADELVVATTSLAVQQRLADLAVPSITYFHPAAEHVTYLLLDNWQKESAASHDDVLVHDPAHLVFRTERSLYHPDLGLVPDRAYWVSQIVPAGDGYADVDARSLGCGKGEPIAATDHGAGTDPVPWVSQDIHVVGTTHVDPQNRLELTVSNVASLHVDVTSACLGAGDVAYHVVTSGPVTITLSDGRTLAFDDAGTHEGTLTARGEQVEAQPVADALARTGGDAPVGPACAVLGVAVAGRVLVRGRGRRRGRRAPGAG